MMENMVTFKKLILSFLEIKTVDFFFTAILMGFLFAMIYQADLEKRVSSYRRQTVIINKQKESLVLFLFFAFLRFIAELYESLVLLYSQLDPSQRAEFLKPLEVGLPGLTFIAIGLFVGYLLSLRSYPGNSRTFLLGRLIFIVMVNIAIMVVLTVQGLGLFLAFIVYDVASIIFLMRDFREGGWCSYFLVRKNNCSKERLAIESYGNRSKAFEVYWRSLFLLFLLLVVLILIVELLTHVSMFELRFNYAKRAGFSYSTEALWVFCIFRISQLIVDWKDFDTWSYLIYDWTINLQVCKLLLLGGTFKLLALFYWMYL